jgi:hypothetical protein
MKWPLVSLFLEEWCVAQKSVCNNDARSRERRERERLSGWRAQERRGAARRGAFFALIPPNKVHSPFRLPKCAGATCNSLKMCAFRALAACLPAADKSAAEPVSLWRHFLLIKCVFTHTLRADDFLRERARISAVCTQQLWEKAACRYSIALLSEVGILWPNHVPAISRSLRFLYLYFHEKCMCCAFYLDRGSAFFQRKSLITRTIRFLKGAACK